MAQQNGAIPPPPTTNTSENLSGLSTSTFSNPYDALLEACNHDPHQIQAHYLTHRTTRNAQQKAKLLSPDFAGISIDPILLRLSDSSIEPGFQDPRHCLVFWARPPSHIRALVHRVQVQLQSVVPNLWLTPPSSLHLTALEITHSRTPSEISSLLSLLHDPRQESRPESLLPALCNSTLTQRTRLVKPYLSYDASALALSFVPAAKTPASYTYHHLRRALYARCTSAGVQVDSRYVVPSAHITIGRFVSRTDFEDEDGKYDRSKMEAFIEKIGEMNAWLEKEYWGGDGEENKDGEWLVGQEKGLDCRMGTLWYGGGETVYLGKGF